LQKRDVQGRGGEREMDNKRLIRKKQGYGKY
jgi:hypothetical protein